MSMSSSETLSLTPSNDNSDFIHTQAGDHVEMKLQGNRFFQENKYRLAIERYMSAIDTLHLNTKASSDTSTYDDFLCVCYTNISIAHNRLEEHGLAIQNSNLALQYKLNHPKALYSRATALFCLQDYRRAAKDFRTVYKINQYKDAWVKREECIRKERYKNLSSAISTDYTEADFDTTTLKIPDDYTGPKYVSGSCDKKFLEDLIEYLKVAGNKFPVKYAIEILKDVEAILREYKSLVYITVPNDENFTICGDIHGQFYDLLNIFSINGLPSKNNPYLFNGDFVDRGAFSVECVLTLFVAKIIYPNHLYLSRGNHETSGINSMYGFKQEVAHKLNSKIYELFSKVFRCLPLAHVINNKYYVVHGGLFSRDNVTLKEIEEINRFVEPADEGLLMELLWSDPQPEMGRAASYRGIACRFGPDVTQNFLDTNNLELVIRSHEMRDAGYQIEQDGKLITIFSAPNYCDYMKNKGALIKLDGKTLTPEFVQFSSVPNPGSSIQYADSVVQYM